MAAAIQNPFALLKKDVEEKSAPAAAESSPKTQKKASKAKSANGKMTENTDRISTMFFKVL